MSYSFTAPHEVSGDINYDPFKVRSIIVQPFKRNFRGYQSLEDILKRLREVRKLGYPVGTLPVDRDDAWRRFAEIRNDVSLEAAMLDGAKGSILKCDRNMVDRSSEPIEM